MMFSAPYIGRQMDQKKVITRHNIYMYLRKDTEKSCSIDIFQMSTSALYIPAHQPLMVSDWRPDWR